MKKIPPAFYQRYIKTLFKYSTPTKLINLLHSYVCYLRGATQISTLPAFLKVEISRHCTVHCRYCIATKAEAFYPFEQYQQLIDRFKKYIFLVSLYDVGEPLLNEAVLDYIEYAHQNRVGTAISTSLSVKKPTDFWKHLTQSGLDYLIVSVDGVTSAVYNQYRSNGDLDLVLSNLQQLLTYKRINRSALAIEWQMVDLPWNKLEQPLAQKMARQLGCDRFRLIPETTLPRLAYQHQNKIRRKNCLLPYIILIINAYNKVRPCYKIYHILNEVGDLTMETFEEIWNGAEMLKIRDKKQIVLRAACRACQE